MWGKALQVSVDAEGGVGRAPGRGGPRYAAGPRRLARALTASSGAGGS